MRDKIDARFNKLHEGVRNGQITEETAKAITELIYIYDEEKLTYDARQYVYETDDNGHTVYGDDDKPIYDTTQCFYDIGTEVPTKPPTEQYRQPTTIHGWLYYLTVFAREVDLLTCDIGEIKHVIQGFYTGSVEHIKDGGLSKASMSSYVSALRVFYGHYDLDIDNDDIPTFRADNTPVNPKDVLTKEEIHRVRNAAANPRDKLVVDLLLYTGQRNTALRNLRIKDIDLDKKTYRYNKEMGGLKGAGKRQGNRPLLGAIGSVRTWINDYHPTGNEDHYLITQQPSYRDVNPDDPVSDETPRRVMNQIKKKTAIDKPMYCHMMRHTFVTICKKFYKMDNDDIKWLIGHSKASTVMETTYSHLSDFDHQKNTEEAWGLRDEEPDESPLTPEFCPNCDEPLAPTDAPLSGTAKACPGCGITLTPDAKSAQDQLQEDMMDTALQVTTDEDRKHFETVKEYIENNQDEMIEIMTQVMKQRQQEES